MGEARRRDLRRCRTAAGRAGVWRRRIRARRRPQRRRRHGGVGRGRAGADRDARAGAGVRAGLRSRRSREAERRGRRRLRGDRRVWRSGTRPGRIGHARAFSGPPHRSRMTVAVLLAAQLTRLPQLLEAPPAAYPPERLARGETADVACSVDIDEHGAVTQVVVEQPVAPDFDAAAVEAIRRFRFSPAEIDGHPAAVRIRYVYHFVVEQKLVEQPRGGARGTVKGTVVEAGTRRPVAGAEAADDTGAQAAADAQGRYSLETSPGPRTLTVSAPGFDTRQIDVVVVEDGAVEARRVWLHRTAVGDLQATIPGEKPHDAPTRRTLTHDELVNVPGSLNDPIRAVQNLPGLARAPFLGGALLVRGSPPQDTGTYLDGHRIPQLYHFLGGPSVINEQLLDRIDFYPGGYGAPYGRNLTGAIDVGTRKGDASGFHGQGALDMIEAVGFVEGPIAPRTQFAMAARRSHIDVFLPL